MVNFSETVAVQTHTFLVRNYRCEFIYRFFFFKYNRYSAALRSSLESIAELGLKLNSRT